MKWSKISWLKRKETAGSRRSGIPILPSAIKREYDFIYDPMNRESDGDVRIPETKLRFLSVLPIISSRLIPAK